MRLNDWKTKPVRSRRSRVARSSDSWLIVSPSRMTSPVVGRSRPPRTWSRVDLPEPDGPIRATNSPACDGERDAAQCLDDCRAERVGLGQVARLEDDRHGRGRLRRVLGHGTIRSGRFGRGALRGACGDGHHPASEEEAGHAADDRLEQSIGSSAIDDAQPDGPPSRPVRLGVVVGSDGAASDAAGAGKIRLSPGDVAVRPELGRRCRGEPGGRGRGPPSESVAASAWAVGLRRRPGVGRGRAVGFGGRLGRRLRGRRAALVGEQDGPHLLAGRALVGADADDVPGLAQDVGPVAGRAHEHAAGSRRSRCRRGSCSSRCSRRRRCSSSRWRRACPRPCRSPGS